MSNEAPVPLAEQQETIDAAGTLLNKLDADHITEIRAASWSLAAGLIAAAMARFAEQHNRATLQQHERAMAALRDTESDLHMLRVAINSVDSYRELLVRVGDMERVISMYVKK